MSVPRGARKEHRDDTVTTDNNKHRKLARVARYMHVCVWWRSLSPTVTVVKRPGPNLSSFNSRSCRRCVWCRRHTSSHNGLAYHGIGSVAPKIYADLLPDGRALDARGGFSIVASRGGVSIVARRLWVAFALCQWFFRPAYGPPRTTDAFARAE